MIKTVIIKEMQIKTTMKYLSPNHNEILLFRWLLSKRTQISNVGEDVEKRKPSYTVCGNINWYSYCGKQHGGFSKN